MFRLTLLAQQRPARFSFLENFFFIFTSLLDLEPFQFHFHFSKMSEGILFFTFHFSKKVKAIRISLFSQEKKSEIGSAFTFFLFQEVKVKLKRLEIEK